MTEDNARCGGAGTEPTSTRLGPLQTTGPNAPRAQVLGVCPLCDTEMPINRNEVIPNHAPGVPAVLKAPTKPRPEWMYE